MSAYQLSTPAETDLHGIWERIARDSVRNAHRFIDALSEKFDKLADNPFLGSACEQFGAGMRFFTFKAYVIYFRKLNGDIEIARVLHGAQDRDAEFGPKNGD